MTTRSVLGLVAALWSIAATAQVNISSNQLGRLSSVGNGSTRTFFQYDQEGRVAATQYVQETLSRVFTTVYGYPQNPQTTVGPGIVPLSESFPDGEQIVYSYDAGGQQVAMRSVFGTTIQDIVRGIRTNARGQVTRFELGNGTVTTRAYDDAGHQGLLLTTTVNSSGDKIQEYGYRYDPNFNVASVSDGVRGDQSVSYTYDALDQLTAVKNADGNPIESYSYDAIGNLVQKGTLEQIYGAGGRPHALASSGGVPYRYDGNGNVTSIGPVTQPQVELEWNPENMPTRVTAGSQVTQKSFVGESLWKKLEQGVTTNYLPGMHLENGVARKYYGGYAERLEDPNDRQLRFYHPDHLGSSSVMTDQNGNVIRRATYWPWGTERGVEGTFTPKQQFNGNEKDVAGFYDYGARLYNPVTGRWLSPDSELGDGLNRYAYVQNNPTSLTDPTGHQSQDPENPCGNDAALHNGKCVPYPDVIEDVVKIDNARGSATVREVPAYAMNWRDPVTNETFPGKKLIGVYTLWNDHRWEYELYEHYTGEWFLTSKLLSNQHGLEDPGLATPYIFLGAKGRMGGGAIRGGIGARAARGGGVRAAISTPGAAGLRSGISRPTAAVRAAIAKEGIRGGNVEARIIHGVVEVSEHADDAMRFYNVTDEMVEMAMQYGARFKDLHNKRTKAYVMHNVVGDKHLVVTVKHFRNRSIVKTVWLSAGQPIKAHWKPDP